MNAVVVVAIGKSLEWDVSKESIEAYCDKYNLTLEVISEPKYNIKPFDKFSNQANLFEKFQIYELFEKYDRILRLDYDLLIAPDCPNLFDVVPKECIGGTYEDIGKAQGDRWFRIRNIQEYFRRLDWSVGYLNAGVIVASKEHREAFNVSLEEIYRAQSVAGIITPEQDYMNYKIRLLGFEVCNLGYKFNHIMHFTENRFNSYIIHYAGSNVFDDDLRERKNSKVDNGLWRELTAEQMRRDWECLINHRGEDYR